MSGTIAELSQNFIDRRSVLRGGPALRWMHDVGAGACSSPRRSEVHRPRFARSQTAPAARADPRSPPPTTTPAPIELQDVRGQRSGRSLPHGPDREVRSTYSLPP